MIKIIVVVGTKTGKTFQKEIEENQALGLMGLKLGDEFDGSIVGLTDYKLQVTGASDKEGFSSRKSIKGNFRVSQVFSGGTGFKVKKAKGFRGRKSVRGNTISEAMAQINVKVVKDGKKSVEDLWGLNSTEAPAENK